MLKIGINIDFALRAYESYDEAFRVVKEAGFECVDFPLFTFNRKDYNVFTYEMNDFIDLFKDIRKKLDIHGLEVSFSHAPFGLDSEADFFTEQYENLIIRSIIATNILGGKYTVVHPIRMGCRYNFNREHAFELNREQLLKYIPFLEKYQVKIALENMYIDDPLRKSMFVSTMFSDAEETVRMIELLGDNFVACLDTGHCLISSRESIYDMTKKLGKHLKVLHVNDNNAILDDHNTPYSGKVDWEGFMKAIKEIDFDGVINFELVIKDPVAFLPHKLKYIYELGNFMRRRIESK